MAAIAVATGCLYAPAWASADTITSDSHKVFGISEPNTVGEAPGYPLEDGVASRISDLGATSHRWVVDWKTVEPQAPRNGVHSYTFAATDRLYAADLAHGIRPLITVLDAPRWAWGPDVPAGSQPYGIPPGSDHLDDWHAFVAATARRYPEALGIEVWNEPDAWGWTRGLLPINPIAYTGLLRSAYDAVKSTTPSIQVVGGAIATYPSTVPGVHLSVSDFLGGMLSAGAARYMDAFSMHSYTAGPSVPSASALHAPLNWVRNAFAANSIALPIWITESGITTSGPTAISEQGQAQTLVNLYRWIQDQSDVKALFIHSLFERWTNPSSKEVGFGLIPQGSGAQPKPAFYALQHETGRVTEPRPPTLAGPSASQSGPPARSTQAASGLDLAASVPAAHAIASRQALRVLIDCHGPCSVRAHGKVTVRTRGGASVSYRVRMKRPAAVDGPTRLRLLPRRRSRNLRLRRGAARVKARVTVVAISGEGAVTKRTFTARRRA